MHSQGQRAVLICIAKGKFHFIPIALRLGASLDPFKFIGVADLINQPFDLFCLDSQLLLVRQALIQTAAADSGVRTGLFFIF